MNKQYKCGNCKTLLNAQEGFNSSIEVWECKKCGAMNSLLEEKKSDIVHNSFKAKIHAGWEKAKPKIKTVGKWALIIGSVVAAIAVVSKGYDNTAETTDDNDDNNESQERALVTHTDGIKTPQYKVELKAFKTGNWYTKTTTNSIASAYSVASCHSYGRAYRIMDAETGRVLKESEEDASMAESNGYPNGYPW